MAHGAAIWAVIKFLKKVNPALLARLIGCPVRKLRRLFAEQPWLVSWAVKAAQASGLDKSVTPTALLETAFGSVLLLVFFYLSLACRVVLVFF